MVFLSRRFRGLMDSGMKHGPTLVVDGQVKSTGKVFSSDDIKKLLL